MFDWVAEWVIRVIETLGYAGLTVLVALENIFPPIPSEVILPLAGFLIGQNRFSFPAVLISTTLGSLIGASVLYGIGMAIGQQRVRGLFERYGKWALLTPDDLSQSETWFDRHGPVAVFIGRLVPVVRSLVSIPAGYRRMPLSQFLLLSGFGSALWNGALVSLGWALGENWREVEDYVGWLQYLVIGAVVFLIARFVWQRRRRVMGSR